MNRKNKLLTAILVILLSSVLLSCEKKQENNDNKEILLLKRTFASMSEKCVEAIPNGDPKEFLSDLQKVLDSEKEFSSEDLSPFFLIDKKHSVPSSYIPKNLVPLKENSTFGINKNNLSLRPEAYNALFEMAEEAKKQGVFLEPEIIFA